MMPGDGDEDMHASLCFTLKLKGPCGNTQVQERMLKAGSETSMVKGPVEDSGVGML